VSAREPTIAGCCVPGRRARVETSLRTSMTRSLDRLAALVGLLPWLVTSAAQPSVSRGATLFQGRCSVCHTVEPGVAGGQGPNLRGVVGRKAAATDFSDSAALSRWGRTWTNELLDRYLTNPGALVPGTTMVVRVPEGRDRADIVAYLASLKAVPTSGAAAPVAVPDAGVPASPRAATAPPVAPDGGVLTGAAAFGDWRSDAPGVRRLIRVEDLPGPFACGARLIKARLARAGPERPIQAFDRERVIRLEWRSQDMTFEDMTFRDMGVDDQAISLPLAAASGDRSRAAARRR